MPMNRRRFMVLGLQSGLASVTFSPLANAALRRWNGPFADPAASPLRPIGGAFASAIYNGDDTKRPHNALWDLENFIASHGGRPAANERRDIVIVGGGMSGLSSAYLLQSRQPLLLEQDFQFGGNSRGEVYGDVAYSLGAAYMMSPAQGTALFQMLQTTGALNGARMEKPEAAKVHLRGRGFLSLGDIDAASAAMVQQIEKDFAQILVNNYPTIPFGPGGASRGELESLDRLTFQQWLQQRYGARVPVALMERLQLYCWSSFAGSMDEISAAQALNFLAAETEGTISFPGGNSYVAQAMYGHLSKTLPPDSLRAGQLVLEVKTNSAGGVNILVLNDDKLQTISCNVCVMAAPKYVAQYLVPEMTPAQKEASKALNYRAYIVGNVLINARVPSPTFDAFALQGDVPPTPSFGNPPRRVFADVTFANWAGGDRASRSVLTLYKPYPYEGARNVIIGDETNPRIQQEMIAGAQEILRALGVSPSAIGGARLTRWGHSLPLARPGFIAGRFDQAFKLPTAGRIFYVNQDNDANPAFETCFANAEIAAASILRSFRR